MIQTISLCIGIILIVLGILLIRMYLIAEEQMEALRLLAVGVLLMAFQYVLPVIMYTTGSSKWLAYAPVLVWVANMLDTQGCILMGAAIYTELGLCGEKDCGVCAATGELCRARVVLLTISLLLIVTTLHTMVGLYAIPYQVEAITTFIDLMVVPSIMYEAVYSGIAIFGLGVAATSLFNRYSTHVGHPGWVLYHALLFLIMSHALQPGWSIVAWFQDASIILALFGYLGFIVPGLMLSFSFNNGDA